MGSRRDRLVVDLVLAALVFVAVSGAVSPSLDALYSWLAVWALIAGGALAVVAGLFWWLDFDRSLDREVAQSWKSISEGGNREHVEALTAQHAAHPEAAPALAARMAEEKARQQQRGLRVVPPPAPPQGGQ